MMNFARRTLKAKSAFTWVRRCAWLSKRVRRQNDVDAIFEPVKEIRLVAARIADKHDLPIGWLNFGVKMFVVEHEKQILFDLPCLKIYAPEADYLLAMKVLAARADTSDLSDIEFLLEKLELETVAQVTKIVGEFYPKKVVKPETVFLLEELLESAK